VCVCVLARMRVHAFVTKDNVFVGLLIENRSPMSRPINTRDDSASRRVIGP